MPLAEIEQSNKSQAWTLVAFRKTGYPPVTGQLVPDRNLEQGIFGQILIEAQALGRLELIDQPLPPDSWVLQ